MSGYRTLEFKIQNSEFNIYNFRLTRYRMSLATARHMCHDEHVPESEACLTTNDERRTTNDERRIQLPLHLRSRPKKTTTQQP